MIATVLELTEEDLNKDAGCGCPNVRIVICHFSKQQAIDSHIWAAMLPHISWVKGIFITLENGIYEVSYKG